MHLFRQLSTLSYLKNVFSKMRHLLLGQDNVICSPALPYGSSLAEDSVEAFAFSFHQLGSFPPAPGLSLGPVNI